MLYVNHKIVEKYNKALLNVLKYYGLNDNCWELNIDSGFIKIILSEAIGFKLNYFEITKLIEELYPKLLPFYNLSETVHLAFIDDTFGDYKRERCLLLFREINEILTEIKVEK